MESLDTHNDAHWVIVIYSRYKREKKIKTMTYYTHHYILRYSQHAAN